MTLSEEKVMDIIKESNISLLSVAYSTRSVETVSIQRLPVFLSAAEHLNFTRAAEEQCISQTAVSQQIKLLEQELGYALFVRGKRGVSLTPAGEVFYRQCRQLMIRYNDAAAQGKKVALGNATDLRIGYAGAYELWTIVSQIRKYHRQHPEAEIEFQLGSNQSLLSGLAEGQLDMAVLYERSPVAGIVSQPLLKEDLYLVGTRDCPGQSVDLTAEAEMNLFLPRDYSAVRARVTEAFTLRRLSAKIIGEIESITTLTAAIASGMGATVLPESAARSLCGAANGWMARISTPSMSLSLSLNMSARGSLSPQAQAVKEILLSLVSRPSLENRELQLVS